MEWKPITTPSKLLFSFKAHLFFISEPTVVLYPVSLAGTPVPLKHFFMRKEEAGIVQKFMLSNIHMVLVFTDASVIPKSFLLECLKFVII